MLNSPPVKDDIFGKYANGTLDFYLGEASEITSGKVIDLNVSVDTSDFLEVLVNAVKRNLNDSIKRNYSFTMDDFRKIRKAFKEKYPDFLMMSKYYDSYEDHKFTLNEVEMLRDECLKLKSVVTGKKADLSLRKIIYGCDQAVNKKIPLLFICD